MFAVGYFTNDFWYRLSCKRPTWAHRRFQCAVGYEYVYLLVWVILRIMMNIVMIL